MSNRKSAVLCSRVIALSAKGMSGRKIAQELSIDKRTVARILASPEAQRIAAAILHSAGVPEDLTPESTATSEQKAPEPTFPASAPPPLSIRNAYDRKA